MLEQETETRLQKMWRLRTAHLDMMMLEYEDVSHLFAEIEVMTGSLVALCEQVEMMCNSRSGLGDGPNLNQLIKTRELARDALASLGKPGDT